MRMLKKAYEFLIAALVTSAAIAILWDLGFDLLSSKIQKSARYCYKICQNEFDLGAKTIGIEDGKVTCICEGKK